MTSGAFQALHLPQADLHVAPAVGADQTIFINVRTAEQLSFPNPLHF